MKAAIDDIKAEIELMRRPRRRVRRYATVIIMVIAGAGFLIASAHADDAQPPATEQQQLANIQRNIVDIYESITVQTERLLLIEMELGVIQRRCAGVEPRPPVWSEP